MDKTEYFFCQLWQPSPWQACSKSPNCGTLFAHALVFRLHALTLCLYFSQKFAAAVSPVINKVLSFDSTFSTPDPIPSSAFRAMDHRSQKKVYASLKKEAKSKEDLQGVVVNMSETTLKAAGASLVSAEASFVSAKAAEMAVAHLTGNTNGGKFDFGLSLLLHWLSANKFSFSCTSAGGVPTSHNAGEAPTSHNAADVASMKISQLKEELQTVFGLEASACNKIEKTKKKAGLVAKVTEMRNSSG
jgi:hypothetical protein